VKACKYKLALLVDPIKTVILIVLAIGAVFTRAQTAGASRGASVPWTTYEAEDMPNNASTWGPQFVPNVVASESSGRECVVLYDTGQYVEFAAQAAANAIVVRYSLPDTTNGVGMDSTLSLYTNGVFAQELPLTSKYSWLYGSYPFVNTPSAGSPRNFYDEVRLNGLSINPGDVMRLQKGSNDTAAYYVIDLVDLETVAPPLTEPPNSLSITAYGAGGAGLTDDTAALRNCISAANAQGASVWLPPGTYMIAGVINIPSNMTIQGAGMWHTTLIGNPLEYTNSSLRVSLNGTGSNIHLSDFAIIGKLNYRNDSEPNDGLVGSYGTGSTISRVWVEHTKTGAWIINSQGLIVDSCRFRDTIADGINLCVGMQGAIVTNCTTRGTGDDCFPIWPATYTQQTYAPGYNLITHCTGELSFLANGGTIYGGPGNRIENCRFQDLTYGCGVLISTTFPVGTNVFGGTNVVQNCDLIRCGGDDTGFGWRGAFQLCMDPNGISGIEISNLDITDSASDGMSIIAPRGSSMLNGQGMLSNTSIANVNILDSGLAVGSYDLSVGNSVLGNMTISNSTLSAFENSSTSFLINFAPPALTITTTASNAVVLSWPSLYAHFALQTNSDVTAANWQLATYQISTNAGINSVTVPLPASSLFFRLWNSD
jgi:Pectate lyase superfamily protein